MATAATDKTTKEAVLDMIRKMPDDTTLADILDAVRLRYEIVEARREIAAGQGIPHEEVERQMAKWLV